MNGISVVIDHVRIGQLNAGDRARDLEADTKWFLHPDRPCKDNPQYEDLKLIKPIAEGTKKYRSRKSQIKALADACHKCPVFNECRIDLLVSTKDWEHYGIRAGIVGKP